MKIITPSNSIPKTSKSFKVKYFYFLIISALIIIAISLLTYILFEINQNMESELQLVTVIFRHGDRMPHTDAGEGYANNPNAENNYFPIGQGGLTNEGKLRAYKLGQFLRERYNNFLDTTYLPEVIEARSTNYERTKTSLQLVLAGLYPPNSYQMWNSSINWQPIPTYYEPETEDILLSTVLCSRFKQEKAKIMEIPEVKDELKAFEGLMKNLTILSEQNINDTFALAKLHYCLMLEQKMNLTIPKWANDYLNNDKMKNALLVDYKIMTYNTLMKKLAAGPVIRKMSEDMLNIRNGSFAKGKKIYLYSGHESNIVMLLSALGIYELHVPKFSSAIMVELRRLQEEYFVQVMYYLGIPPEIHIQEIPGCSKLCPLDKFLELLKPVTPEKDEIKCDL